MRTFRRAIFLSLVLAVVLGFAFACDNGDTKTDGDTPDGDTDGDQPDGDQPDGDQPDGDQPDGDQPDGDQPDGDQPDGDQPDGDVDGDVVTDGDLEVDGDIDGDDDEAAPGHTENMDGTFHKPGKEDPLNNCVGCHGDSLEGAVGKSCYTCHNSNDHSVSRHGVLHSVGTTCSNCHGPNNSGGLGPACSDCH